MKALYLTLIASAVLLASSIARADECPPGQGIMGQGMGMGRGMGMMGQRQGMRVMMILMDTDGDGALSLEEVQAAHAKIFKAVDADKNGKATLEEIQTFFGGGSTSH
jgi:Ca2+-binding EF-hand superfamily protein